MAYIPLTWVEKVTTTGPTNFNHMEQGIATADANATTGIANAAAAQTTANAAVPKSTVTTAADLIVATGNAAVTRLGVGAAGQVLAVVGGVLTWVYPPGYVFAYNEFTANVSITATTEATANTVVTASAVTFDGATTVMIEFFCQNVIKGTTNTGLWLYDGSSSIGQIGAQIDQGSLQVARRLTPAAATKTYSIRGTVDAGTGTTAAGAGGVGVSMPGFIQITKV